MVSKSSWQTHLWTELQKRSASGAKFLDSVNPTWWQNVYVNELDLQCCFNCVLGQLYETYDNGKQRLLLGEEQASLLGFNLGENEIDRYDYEISYHILSEVWAQEIINRREEVTGMNIGEEQPAIVVEPLEAPAESPAPEESPAPVKETEKEPALV